MWTILVACAHTRPPLPQKDDCNPSVPGWRVEVASVNAASPAEAREQARVTAGDKLYARMCPDDTTWSPTRCAAVRQAIMPFPGMLVSEKGRQAEACATAGIHADVVDAWGREEQQLDAGLAAVSAAAAKEAEGKAVVVAPATWSTGGPAGDLGRVVTARLLALAQGPWRSELAYPGVAGERRMVVELTAQQDGLVVLVPRLDTVGAERTVALPGMRFHADLLGFPAVDLRDGIPDADIGLDDAHRVGAQGLVARLEVTAKDGKLCPGAEFSPKMSVNLDADVRLLNLSPTGKTQLVWSGTIPAGGTEQRLLEAIYAPGGPERLVMLASPAGRGLGRVTGWTAWCEADTVPDLFPRDAAVATSTFSISSPGWAGCPSVVGGTYPEPPRCP